MKTSEKKSSLWFKIKVFFGFEEPLDETSHTLEPETKLHVYSANSYEDSAQISSYLRLGQPVILDIAYLDDSQSHRLLDFVCGSIFATNGQVKKLSKHLYLFSPERIPLVIKQPHSQTPSYDAQP